MKKYSLEQLNEIFDSVERSGINYTTVMFESLTGVSTKVFCSYFKLSWIDYLIKKGVFDLLYTYVIEQYSIFIKQSGKVGISEFVKFNKYITTKLIYAIGFDKIKSQCGIVKQRYTDEQYKDNFYKIIHKVNHVPLYSEFMENTSISIASYAAKYGLKGKVYNNIVKMYVTNEEYMSFLNMTRKRKQENILTNNIIGNQIKDEDLKNNLCTIFDGYYNKYGVYPSRRLFNIVSKYDDSTYRRRLKKSWSDVCEYYGYYIDKNHTEEKILLGMVAKILHENYEPQKTWDWLIGIGGKHMYCDGYFAKHNLVIEYDGVGHRKSVPKFGGEERFKRQQENDILKDQLLLEHDICVARIDSRSDWHDEKYLSNKIAEILGSSAPPIKMKPKYRSA